MKNRLTLFKKELVNGNLEVDYLSNKVINFDTFPTQERVFIVRSDVLGRIDLISYEVYRTVDLWWLIALRNDIIDPVDGLYLGQKLYIPSLLDYYDFYNKNLKPEDEVDVTFDQRRIS
jgi:hypothetical protein